MLSCAHCQTATIYPERGAGYECGLIREQPRNSFCDFFGLTKAAHRNPARDLFSATLIEMLQAFRENLTRRHNIDSDIALRVVERRGLREADNRVLRGHVAGDTWNSRSPAVDDMFTIDPPLDASIAGISYFMHKNTPMTFTRNADSNSATLSSASGFGEGPPPALLNAASRRPNLSTVASTRRSTEIGSPTSVDTASALPPWRVMSSASAAISWPLLAARTTVAPAAENVRAAAFPIPRLAPVMITTLSRRRPVGVSHWVTARSLMPLPRASSSGPR